MTQEQARAETVSLLQDLGLKEYEARCFLALSQVPSATAKEISELSEVPRTRVYDAVRVLEAQGLVEVQHSNPQKFRAVTITEAMSTLRQRYDDRIETLQTYLEEIELNGGTETPERTQEVWSLTGPKGIESRSFDLIDNADSEIVVLVAESEIVSESLLDRLEAAMDRGVNVTIGAFTESTTSLIESELPAAKSVTAELDWLVGSEDDTPVTISRLLLVDHSKMLISSFYPTNIEEGSNEQAVFAKGLDNGIVVLVRRLLSSGLLST